MSLKKPVKHFLGKQIFYYILEKVIIFGYFGRNKVVFLTKCHILQSAKDPFLSCLKSIRKVVEKQVGTASGFPPYFKAIIYPN